MKKNILRIAVLILGVTACQPRGTQQTTDPMEARVNEFAEVTLNSELFQSLTENQKEMVSILFDAAKIMDDIFWYEAYGSKDSLFQTVTDTFAQEFLNINYGPWERLNDNQPFIEGFGPKPKGANFYPPDMTVDEFSDLDDPAKNSLYTFIRRDQNGHLVVVPYHIALEPQVTKAGVLLRKAAELAENPEFARYLKLRANALMNDDYYPSDLAWMDVRDNDVDLVIGPIENYEDGLFGMKAAHEAFILLKDRAWSERLSRFSAFLPDLQKQLPVPDKYKQESPGSDSDLGAYDVIYYAGDCNAGSKTIAINLPNDERVQTEKGSRKLQLKNAMRYKFEQILVPISRLLIADDQQKHITFDAFFENTMFHEVAHGLGIKNTLDGSGTVREALKEQYSALEEGKADILGLFLIQKLYEMGELGEKDLMDNYVTFLAGIFRSVRFGAASAHGKANMIRFYYFQEKGAFSRDSISGTYRVNFDKMTEAMNSLARELLIIQGDGNYEAAKALVAEKGDIRKDLQNDLDRISEAGIPRDIRFDQGKHIFGL